MLKNDGFTLIEMMIVLSILAIIASIAAPSMSNQLAKWELKDCAEKAMVQIVENRTMSAIEPPSAITISADGCDSVSMVMEPAGTAQIAFERKRLVRPSGTGFAPVTDNIRFVFAATSNANIGSKVVTVFPYEAPVIGGSVVN